MVSEKETTSQGKMGNPRVFLWIALAVGSSCFLWALSSGQTQRAWQAYLVNLVFWLGVCAGSVTLVALLNMTNAGWARPLKRLAEAGAFALPALWLLLLFLYLGHKDLYSWAVEPVHGKEVWLSAGFLFGRDTVVLGFIVLVALVLVHSSVKGDLKWIIGSGQEVQTPWRMQVVLSPVLAVLYGLGMSLLAWDLIMSLDPHWVSTLFGTYYFMGSLYTGIAWVIVLSAILWRKGQFQGRIEVSQFHDLGKLLLAFCLVTGDFFYSQFLVIWYGNIPEETKYVILRVRTWPWNVLAWSVLIGGFGIPFVVLLSRKLKKKPGLLGSLGVLILLAMWLERFLLVAPSVSSKESLPLGILELGISLGFVGLVGVCVSWFLSRVPWLPLGDPLFRARFPEFQSPKGKGFKAGAEAGYG